MTKRQLKAGYFVLEGLNSFSTVFYVYYLYFFTQRVFGFGAKANFGLAALNGALCAVGSLLGGKFAQRRGYHKALKVGFAVMMFSLAIGSHLTSAPGQVCAMSAMVLGMCFTWPTLEALISEDEPPEHLPRMIGIYNVVWAAGGALAYFIGGAVMDKMGLRSIFYVPASIQFFLLILTAWLEKRSAGLRPGVLGQGVGPAPHRDGMQAGPQHAESETGAPLEEGLGRTVSRQTFVRLAWLANPFAYLAINSLVAIVPTLSNRLGLSVARAGFYCSIWCFARVAAFFVLWFWTGWHYRFRWLLAAYLVMSATFVAMLFAPNIPMLITAQIGFGGALGLIYYSSLFYSMDLSETKGEHGGIHEAAINIGNFAGPAIGAASLQFLPQHANGGIVAVSGLLMAGLGGLLVIWRRGRKG